MMDIIYLALVVLFFGAAILYVRGCAKLEEEQSND